MNVEIVTEGAQFLFWEYIKSKFLCSAELELLYIVQFRFVMLNNNKWHVPEVSCKNAQECRDAGFDGLPPGVMDFRQALTGNPRLFTSTRNMIFLGIAAPDT